MCRRLGLEKLPGKFTRKRYLPEKKNAKVQFQTQKFIKLRLNSNQYFPPRVSKRIQEFLHKTNRFSWK